LNPWGRERLRERLRNMCSTGRGSIAKRGLGQKEKRKSLKRRVHRDCVGGRDGRRAGKAEALVRSVIEKGIIGEGMKKEKKQIANRFGRSVRDSRERNENWVRTRRAIVAKHWTKEEGVFSDLSSFRKN